MLFLVLVYVFNNYFNLFEFVAAILEKGLLFTNQKLFINSLTFFQLSDAVSVIGREDFPDKWKNLLPVRIITSFKLMSVYLVCVN